MHVGHRPTARSSDVRAAHLRAAPLLRGVPARPRLHRGPGHHRPHLRDLPGRLPDELRATRSSRPAAPSARRAAPRACAASSTAGSGSRATRSTSTCCTLPTSSAYGSALELAKDHRDLVEQALALKKVGNDLMDAPRRPRDPPHQRPARRLLPRPHQAELRPLAERLRWARDAALETVRLVSGFDFPDLRDRPRVRGAPPSRRVRHHARGGWSPTAASTSRWRSSWSTSSRSTSSTRPRSTAACIERGRYLVGPLARYALNYDQLPAGGP